MLSRRTLYQQVAAEYWQVNRLALRAGARTVVRRVRRQPRAGEWSLRYESIIEFMTLGVPAGEQIAVEQIRRPLERGQTLARALPLVRRPVQHGEWTGEWFTMPHSREERVILYLHGGGYVSGSPRSHRAVIAYLAHHAHARALALDYRLAPEHPFPAALEDAWSAYWWLLCQGVKPEQIVVAGDSAGGGLTVALLLALRDAHVPLPAGGICLSPWLDLTFSGATLHANRLTDYLNRDVLRTTAEMYLAGHDPCDPLVSPLFADLHGLPPLLVQAGGAEMLLDDGRRFAQRAQTAGVDVTFELWPGMVHVWHFTYLFEPKARQAVQSAGRFARRQWRDTDDGQESSPYLLYRPRPRAARFTFRPGGAARQPGGGHPVAPGQPAGNRGH